MIALTDGQRRAVIGCGLALVIGSVAFWPAIARSQFSPAPTATPDPAALSAYRPEALPLRDYSHDPDPFRADILSTADGKPLPTVVGDLPHVPSIGAAPPGVVPDITSVRLPGSLGVGNQSGREKYGTVRGLGSDFALIERNGSLPIVRVGDTLGDAQIVQISESGVVLSNGVVLTLDTSSEAPPPAAPRIAPDAKPTPTAPGASPSPSPAQDVSSPAPAPPGLTPRLAPTQGGSNP